MDSHLCQCIKCFQRTKIWFYSFQKLLEPTWRSPWAVWPGCRGTFWHSSPPEMPWHKPWAQHSPERRRSVKVKPNNQNLFKSPCCEGVPTLTLTLPCSFSCSRIMSTSSMLHSWLSSETLRDISSMATSIGFISVLCCSTTWIRFFR